MGAGLMLILPPLRARQGSAPAGLSSAPPGCPHSLLLGCWKLCYAGTVFRGLCALSRPAGISPGGYSNILAPQPKSPHRKPCGV